MKVWLASVGVIAVVALLLFGYAHLRTDTYLGRWFAWRASDVGDMEGDLLEQPLEVSRRGALTVTNLGELLATSDTISLVVLREGKVLMEWYAAGPPATARDQPVTTFSVSKSVTSLLVGAALADGLIESLEDPITQYLPEYRSVDPGYEGVTVRHLLAMRSGIRFRDHDLPWGDKARVYYEPRLRDHVSRLGLEASAGGDLKYNSYNSVVLGLLLERLTGGSVAEYAERRLWDPLGAEYPASWSVSGPGETLAKMESGFNARPIDLARIGQLLLDGGVVPTGSDDDRRILPQEWMDGSMATQPEDLVDPSTGLHYSLGWWVYAPDAHRPYAVSAQGHLGQYLFVYPEQRVVIARFGRSLGGVGSWRSVFDWLAVTAASAG